MEFVPDNDHSLMLARSHAALGRPRRCSRDPTLPGPRSSPPGCRSAHVHLQRRSSPPCGWRPRAVRATAAALSEDRSADVRRPPKGSFDRSRRTPVSLSCPSCSRAAPTAAAATPTHCQTRRTTARRGRRRLMAPARTRHSKRWEATTTTRGERSSAVERRRQRAALHTVTMAIGYAFPIVLLQAASSSATSCWRGAVHRCATAARPPPATARQGRCGSSTHTHRALLRTARRG